MASLALSLLLAPDARAGTWSFTCAGSGSDKGSQSYTFYGTPYTSSGSTAWTPPASTTGTSFQIPSFGYNSFPGGTFTSVGTNDSQSQSLTVSPVLTVKWVPDPTLPSDPAPTAVIMSETSSATWTAQYQDGTPGIHYGGGGADDGLGDPLVKTYSGGVQLGGTMSCTNAAHYSAPAVSGGSVTVPNHTFTASANASLPNDGSQGAMNVGCLFGGYTLVLAVPTVQIGGTYNPSAGDNRVLTGQQITATLQGLSGYTVTKYTWAVGGSAFKNYDPTLPSNQLSALGSTDLTGPPKGSSTVAPLAFYDSTAENLTVTCAVTVLAPDGTSLNITATSPTINVLKPTLTGSGIAEGYVQLATDGSAFGLYGNLSGTGNSTNGMIWSNFIVNVPAPFSGNGQCTFTQLVNPNHLEYVNGSSIPIGTNNGTLGLDGSFEYGVPWNVTGAGNDVDSPNQPLFYRTGLTEISVSDAFTTYIMYQPSGGVWVPLDKFSWTYGMTLNWVPQTSQFSLTASYPHTAGQVGTPTPTTTTSPPQWTVIQNQE